MNYKQTVQIAADQLRQQLGVSDFSKYAMVVLGSGFKGFVDIVTPKQRVDLTSIAGIPVPKVAGHGSEVVVIETPRPALVFSGRVHLYEGYSANDVTFTVRMCFELGIRDLILTNASGSVTPNLRAGDIVCIEDHINFSGHSSIAGAEPYGGERFVDMVGAYDKELVAQITSKLALTKAVYMQVSGPAYETPAETKAFRIMGADVVGMSTVQETLAARQLGMRVCCLSLVTNQAGGLADAVDHAEVLQTGLERRDILAKTLLQTLEITAK